MSPNESLPPADGKSETVDRLIRRRFSCRRFTNQDVPRETIEQILEVARFAPSSSNTQPWHVYVLSGETKNEVSRVLLAAHSGDPNLHRAEQEPSVPLPKEHVTRREEYGKIFYSYLGIERSDMTARAAVTARNYSFFDAPIGMIFSVDRRLGTASWVDLGLFIQNIMLAACARGLETCPQETFAKYHRLLRELLPIPSEQIVVCGMSIGFCDHAALEGRPAIPRLPVSEFTSFLGF